MKRKIVMARPTGPIERLAKLTSQLATTAFVYRVDNLRHEVDRLILAAESVPPPARPYTGAATFSVGWSPVIRGSCTGITFRIRELSHVRILTESLPLILKEAVPGIRVFPTNSRVTYMTWFSEKCLDQRLRNVYVLLRLFRDLKDTDLEKIRAVMGIPHES